MKTATLHLDNLVGYCRSGMGLARCYKLSEPADFDGDGHAHDYAIVRVLWPTDHTAGAVAVFPGTETGAIAEISLKSRIGSYTLKGNPKHDPAYIEGCFHMALGLNGFTINE